MSEATSLLVKLASPEGQQLEKEARKCISGSVFQPNMSAVFAKQVGNSACGIQTCGMILNAAYINRHCQGIAIPQDLPYLEKKMFEHPATLTVTNYNSVEMNKNGTTLDDVADILTAHGLKVNKYRTSNLSVAEFRTIVSSALAEPTKFVSVNYYMLALGEGLPCGHHSPVASYHASTDRFLVLDVWYDVDENWVLAEELYKAMNTIDDETGKTRGFLVAECINQTPLK